MNKDEEDRTQLSFYLVRDEGKWILYFIRKRAIIPSREFECLMFSKAVSFQFAKVWICGVKVRDEIRFHTRWNQKMSFRPGENHL